MLKAFLYRGWRVDPSVLYRPIYIPLLSLLSFNDLPWENIEKSRPDVSIVFSRRSLSLGKRGHFWAFKKVSEIIYRVIKLNSNSSAPIVPIYTLLDRNDFFEFNGAID